MAQLLLAKTLKKRANSKSSSLSKKIGFGFVCFSIAIGVSLSDRVSLIPTEEPISKAVHLNIAEHEESDSDSNGLENLDSNYSSPEEQLEDQDEENSRLILQRDVSQKIKSVFVKPFNYKNGFSCTLKVTKERKLVPLNCENNSVYLRSVDRALEKLSFKNIEQSSIKSETFLIKVTL